VSLLRDPCPRKKRPGERSFTLIETVIALSLITFLVVEVAGVQGNSVVFAEYNRNITHASWLARRVMSQIEYYYRTKPFPDLIKEVKDGKFEDIPDFTYAIDIKEWKFPFIKLLQSTLGGGPGGGDSGENTKAEKAKDADKGVAQLLDQVVSQIFGKEPIFMTAHVTVSWPEGAARGSTELMYLLTNQAKLDEAIVAMRPTWDQCIKSQQEKPNKTNPTPGSGGTPGSNPGSNPGSAPAPGTAPGSGGNPPPENGMEVPPSPG
jgi:type II secretory pathway pseudopilin PulG